MTINDTKKVIPSIPASSFNELESLFNSLRGVVDEVQVDMVDGKFAPFTSWPFTESSREEDIKSEFKKLSPFVDDFAIEIDCMIISPERFLDLFVSVGVRRVIIHMGSTEKYNEIIGHAHTHGYKVGLGLVNDVPLGDLKPYIDDIDFVQLMGIKAIGQQGQPFDDRTLGRVAELRKLYPSLEIAVDGSVNRETIEDLAKVGVNRFAPGSAVAKDDNPSRALKALVELAQI